MNWFILSLLCAVAEAAKDAACKVATRDADALTISLACLLIPLPYFAVALFFEPIPALDGYFFLALICHASMFSLSLYLYNQALQSSPLSLTVPLICFTPAFFVFTSPLILGESISPSGLLGCLLIAAGAYSMYLTPGAFNLLGPLRAIAREKGARYMLLVAFIWSVTANFDRMGVLHSSRSFWPPISISAISILLAGARKLTGSKAAVFTRANLLAGVLSGLSIYFYFRGISIQKAAYVVTVKRCSVLFGVVLGYFLFGETNIRRRLLGAAIMLLGVLCVAVAT